MSRKKARQKVERRKYSMVEIAGFAAIGIFVIGILWLFLSPPPPAGQTMTTYTPAPDFTLADVDGNTFRLSDQRGKVVVLVFMRTTCPACVAENPHLTELRAKFGGDVVMLMISIDPTGDTDSVLRDYRNQNVVGWIAAVDKAGMSTSLGYEDAQRTTPTIFIIDKNGYMRYRHVGLTQASTLIGEIEGL